MALNIKSVEAERLARQLAAEHNTTITEAILRALRAELQRRRGRRTAPSLRDALLAISDRCASLPDLDTRTANEILGYDENGGFR